MSNTQPLFSANAKYTNGVAPGYWPTKGGGLTLHLSAGTAVCGSPPMTAYYAGGTLTLPANKTNYVYIMSAGLGLQPTSATATPSSTGGSLAAGNYKVAVTYVNPSGESLWGAETTVTTSGSSSKITVTSPVAYLNATGYNVYVSAVNGASGSETKQNTSQVALGTNYVVTSVVGGGVGLPEIADTTACAPWYTNTTNPILGHSGFPQGQRPIAVVTTDNSTITSITDARTWFDATTALDSGNQVYNVMAYGACGDGVCDDTAAIQAAINAAMDWLGGIIYFPAGTYRITSGLTWQLAALEFRGAGQASILEIEHGGDAITIPSNASGFKMEDLQIWVNYGSSRGTNAIIANSAGDGLIRNIVVQSMTTSNAGVFYRCTTSGADNWWFDTIFILGGANTTWTNYFLLQNSSNSQTLASYFWTNVGGDSGLTDAGWDLNGMLDTMWLTQSGVTMPSGAASAPGIWVQNTLSSMTEFPRWIWCHSCGIEAPGQTGLKIDAGKNIDYSGYFAGSTTGIAVGASAVEVNVYDTVFVWIGQSAITYAGTGGLQVHDNQFDGSGQQTNNSYDTIAVANSAGNFQVVDNYWRNSTYFSSNLPRYGVNVGTGAADYVIARNRFQGTSFGTAFLYDQTAAGHGGFFGSVINAGSTGTTTSALGSTNQVRVIEFTLPDQRLINRVVCEVTTPYSGGHYSVGLYNQPGTSKLVDSGTISTTSAQVNSVTLSSPVTLPPGVYWLAWCGDNTTFLLRAFSTGQSASTNMMNQNVARQGSAANSCTSGALPSSLGSIAATSLNAPSVWFEP